MSEVLLSADHRTAAAFADPVDVIIRPVGRRAASVDPVRTYLNEIGGTPLLKAEEEVDLAQRIEAGLFAGKLLAGQVESSMAPNSDNPDAESVKVYRGELAEIARDGDAAKTHLFQANLRLVVSVAKRYTGYGMPFLDIIQEGNLGLVRAVEKFDYMKGFKFSTYAKWWIRQGITRAMPDQGRSIPIPVHFYEQVSQVDRIQRQLLRDTGREPTFEEIGAEADRTPQEVEELLEYKKDVISLDQQIGDGETRFGDFIPDARGVDPYENSERSLMQAGVHNVLKDLLDDRERRVIAELYGLAGEEPKSQQKIADAMGISRAGVGLIAQKAKAKLTPSSFAHLADFLE